METIRKCLFPHLTLQHRAAVSVVTMAWKHRDLNRLSSSMVNGSVIWFQEIEQVFHILASLQLPPSAQDAVFEMTHLIVDEMINWLKDFNFGFKHLFESADLNVDLQWSLCGALDYMGTAMSLKRHLPHVVFESNPNKVWLSLNNIYRATCMVRPGYADTELSFYILDTDPGQFLSVLESVCTHDANLPDYACEVNRLLLLKLFLRAPPYFEFHADSWLYLLYKVGEDNTKALVSEFPQDILCQLLHWPFCLCFMDIARMAYDNLTEDSFCNILEKIKEDDKFSYSKRLASKIFSDFYNEAPEDLRRSFVENKILGNLLTNLFSPTSLNDAMLMLFRKGNVLSDLKRILICDSRALLILLQEENQWKGFQYLVNHFFGVESVINNFDNVYRKMCKEYLTEYYGEPM